MGREIKMQNELRKVAIVWNGSFRAHKVPEGHPETPDRVEVILSALQKNNLMRSDNSFCIMRKSAQEVLMCHMKGYIRLIEQACASLKNGQIALLSTGDVTITRESFQVAQDAVSAVCLAVDVVMQGDYSSAFVAVRPPGHHAESYRGMGFCLFNNVAIAARYAQKRWRITKVAIIDWDVHHGNGTEEIFRKDESILYVSTHQEGVYPGTGMVECRGTKGEHIVNIPIPAGEESRELLRDFYLKELPQLLMKFSPELILISCGFDAHELDPLGGLKLQSADFGDMTTAILQVSNALPDCRVISVLEGGYDLTALSEGSVAVVAALSS